MIKSIFPVVFLFISLVGKGQYSLTFCENVNDDGKALMPSNSFMIGKDGSAMKLLLKSEEKIKTDKMDFKIFYINDNGKEEEISQLPAKISPDWNYFWKEIVFFDPGNYRVKVYNGAGTYLTSTNVNVKQQ